MTALLAIGYTKALYLEWFTTPYRKENSIVAHQELCQQGLVPFRNTKKRLDEQAAADLRTLFCKDMPAAGFPRNSSKANVQLGMSAAQTTSVPPTPPQVAVSTWGPTETKLGQAVNRQADGVSAIWIRVAGIQADPATRVTFGVQHASPATVTPELVTTAVPQAVIGSAGEYPVVIEEPNGRRTAVGTFRVQP
jgi:hypothetical protein